MTLLVAFRNFLSGSFTLGGRKTKTLRPYCINVDVVFQKEELGRLLINIFAVVPGGVVCFFSSYDYEQQVYKHWQTTGILDKMNARKKVYFSVHLFLLTLKASLSV